MKQLPKQRDFQASESGRMLRGGAYTQLFFGTAVLMMARYGSRAICHELFSLFPGRAASAAGTLCGDLICFFLCLPLLACIYGRARFLYCGEKTACSVRFAPLYRLGAVYLAAFCVMAISIWGGLKLSVDWYRAIEPGYGRIAAALGVCWILAVGIGLAGTVFVEISRRLAAFRLILTQSVSVRDALRQSRRSSLPHSASCVRLLRRICVWFLLSCLTGGLAGLLWGVPYCMCCAVICFENLPEAEPASARTSVCTDIILLPRSEEPWQKNSI